MMSNVPGQGYLANVNAAGANRASSQYALLIRMAELDVELARSATAVGVAVKLLSTEDIAAFGSYLPQPTTTKQP
jgi:hypothetical protein